MLIIGKMDNFILGNRGTRATRLLFIVVVALHGRTCYCQETTLPRIDIATYTTSMCYQQSVLASCPAGSQIAISSASHGFKNMGGICTSDNTGADCLQEDTSPLYRDGLSGKPDGTVECSNAVKGTCNSTELSPTSSSCQLSYQCIPNNKIVHVCSPGMINSSDGNRVYIRNLGYPNSGILPADTSCSFSVEINSYANIDMYIIDQELMYVGDCKQTIEIANRTDVLQTFDCESPRYNFIRKRTIQGTYVNVSLINDYASIGGKLWYGFQASDKTGGIVLNSPSENQKLFVGCGTPKSSPNAIVSSAETSYQSTVDYICISGYAPSYGNSTRTCLSDGTWSGQPLECAYECSSLTNPEDGTVTVTGYLPVDSSAYSCKEGFILLGNNRRFCIDREGWNGTMPLCFKNEIITTSETTLPGIYLSDTTVCYQQSVVASCPNGSKIAITSANHGFQNMGGVCTPDNTGADCLQEDTSPLYRDGLSGKPDGTVECSNAVKGTCNSTELSPTSSSCQLSYQCLPNNRIAQMCSPGMVSSSDGQAVYIQNLGYPNSGILATDTSCSFSVEINSYANIDLYIIDQELMSAGDCKQTVQIANMTHVLQTFDYKSPIYNFIRKLTIPGTYVNVSLINVYTATGGKFWYGFQASDNTGEIIINSPSENQKLFLGCPRPINTTSVIITYNGTAYLSVATYTCSSNYVHVSGDVTRTCQANGIWSGRRYICRYDSTIPTEIDVGTVVGIAFGVLAVGIFVGAAGHFVCQRLKAHRARPTNDENMDLGIRRQDVSDGQSLPSERGTSTSDVQDIHEYHTLDFNSDNPDPTYTSLSS